MKKVRAMIVDDNPTDRAYVRAILNYLTEGQVQADEAESADIAMELFQPGRYDLVVADYHLTGSQTGFEVLENARKIDPKCRRVMITGDSRQALAHEARRGELAESVVLKSWGPARVRDALSPLLPTA